MRLLFCSIFVFGLFSYSLAETREIAWEVLFWEPQYRMELKGWTVREGKNGYEATLRISYKVSDAARYSLYSTQSSKDPLADALARIEIEGPGEGEVDFTIREGLGRNISFYLGLFRTPLDSVSPVSARVGGMFLFLTPAQSFAHKKNIQPSGFPDVVPAGHYAIVGVKNPRVYTVSEHLTITKAIEQSGGPPQCSVCYAKGGGAELWRRLGVSTLVRKGQSFKVERTDLEHWVLESGDQLTITHLLYDQSEEPSQALLPTPTPVTPPAGQESRQP